MFAILISICDTDLADKICNSEKNEEFMLNLIA